MGSDEKAKRAAYMHEYSARNHEHINQYQKKGV